VAAAWEETVVQGTLASRSGPLLEGTAGLAASVLELRLSYRQGSLAAAGGGNQRKLVEGAALLGVRIVPWLKVEAGPRVRAYVTSAGTERWVFWDGQIEASARVIRGAGWAYLRVGRTLGGDLPGLTLDRGQGAQGGLDLRLGHSPLWARLGYWIHHTRIGGGQREETVQGMWAGAMLAR
jgi:hypothetical protein